MALAQVVADYHLVVFSPQPYLMGLHYLSFVAVFRSDPGVQSATYNEIMVMNSSLGGADFWVSRPSGWEAGGSDLLAVMAPIDGPSGHTGGR